jgi:putative ABC transport system permease protein
MTRRSIRGSLSRFLSILSIIALGAGFLAGLISSTPDMQKTADKYFVSHNAYDYDITGTLGLTAGDIKAISGLSEVDKVMPVYKRDMTVENYADKEKYTVRMTAFDFAARNSDDFINRSDLLKGRYPEKDNECVLEISNIYTSNHKLGEELTISKDDRDYDEIRGDFKYKKFRVVGIVRTPMFISAHGEVTTAGDGSVMLGVYVRKQACKASVYTDAYVTLTGADKLSRFSDDYSDLVSSDKTVLKDLGRERSSIRSREVIGRAQQKVDKVEKKYQKKKAETSSQLADAAYKINAGKQKLNSSEDKIKASEAALKEQSSSVDAKEDQLDALDKKLAAGQAYVDQLKQLRDSGAALTEEQTAAVEAYDSGMAQLSAGRTAIASARSRISAAYKKLAKAQAAIDSSRAELAAQESKYLQARAKAEKSFAGAEKKLRDAQDEVDKIKNAKWYLNSFEDSVGFSNYKSDVDKVSAVAKVFPVFFFLVAVLVALTTMTRLIDEERELIGTLKSLGYSRRKIMQYYMSYALEASAGGCVIGMALGFPLFPKIIGNAYTMMYDLPATETEFIWKYAVVIGLVMIISILGTTYLACARTLRERPAMLLLPEAPSPGKRILLERIGPLWRRLSFTRKVTCRNLFRYKKRFLMTIIGVAGCFALLITGFGVRDSIGDIVHKQYDELFHYDFTVEVTNDKWTAKDKTLADTLGNKDLVKSYISYFSDKAHTEDTKGKDMDINVISPQNDAAFTDFVTLRSRSTGKNVPFGRNSAVINEKAAESIGAKTGDKVKFTLSSDKSITVKITGITENYVASYLYLGDNVYSAPNHRHLMVKMAKGADNDKVMEKLLDSSRVSYVVSTEYVKSNFADSVKSINYIVIVLIVCAGALAVIVLYNLTNVNICERKKELATIKVLGFFDREVSAYIFREINMLAGIGILFGVPVGIWLHKFVIRTVEVNSVMFGQNIEWPSYLYAAGLTVLFTIFVNLIMRRKIKDIDMVESMKAND